VRTACPIAKPRSDVHLARFGSSRSLLRFFEKHDIEHQIRLPFVLGNVGRGRLENLHFAGLERFLVGLAVGPYARESPAFQCAYDAEWARNIRGGITWPERNLDDAGFVVLIQ